MVEEGEPVSNGDTQTAIVAVGEARTALPKPDLSDVKQVDSQTKAIGLIHPPPDIRAIVDKTAQFVARSGVFSWVFGLPLSSCDFCAAMHPCVMHRKACWQVA
jgi:hypothetical protein